jgi:hypothetical protein
MDAKGAFVRRGVGYPIHFLHEKISGTKELQWNITIIKHAYLSTR